MAKKQTTRKRPSKPKTKSGQKTAYGGFKKPRRKKKKA
jgi:hypothetical protein